MEQVFKLYDRLQKQILKHKSVIALIIKLSFKEFKGLTVQEIADHYIVEENNEKNPIVLGEDGEINLLDRQVQFDSLFRIVFPDEKVGYVNIEIQNDFGYHQREFSRSFAYSGFLIVLQIGVEIVHQHYEDFKKTASIWLITDGPKELDGNVIRCFIEQENLIGEGKINPEYIDLINNVYIFLTKDGRIESEEMKVLNALINPYMDHQLREDILSDQEEFLTFYQEVSDMEGNGRAIYEQGIQQGLEKGKMDTILTLFKQLLNDQYSYDQIVKLLHLDEEDQAKYRELLNL